MELLYVVKGAFGVEIHYVPSWFLITLFFAGLAVYWPESKNKKKIIIEIVILTAISIIGNRVIDKTDIRSIRHIVLFISRISIATVFMLFGLLWRRLDFSKINKVFAFFVCLAVTLILPFFLEWESISSFSISYVLPFILTGITGTCVVIAISNRINYRFLRFLGKESLIIMGTHQAVRFAMLFRLPNVYNSKNVIPIYLVGVIVLDSILIPLLNRFVPFLIGKSEFPLLKKYKR